MSGEFYYGSAVAFLGGALTGIVIGAGIGASVTTKHFEAICKTELMGSKAVSTVYEKADALRPKVTFAVHRPGLRP